MSRINRKNANSIFFTQLLAYILIIHGLLNKVLKNNHSQSLIILKCKFLISLMKKFLRRYRTISF